MMYREERVRDGQGLILHLFDQARAAELTLRKGFLPPHHHHSTPTATAFCLGCLHGLPELAIIHKVRAGKKHELALKRV